MNLITTASIEASKSFQRLGEKSQVLPPELGRTEVVKTRLTHSYDVATSAEMIANSLNIGIHIDYMNALKNVCLSHDLGHPPFGHTGAGVISKKFISLGLKDGFKDNNNNFVILEKEQIEMSNYELASLIKYPEKLYEEQKGKYLKILERAIEQDIEYFSSKIKINVHPKRTLICEIMDEADRNSYVCSDLTDFYQLGWGNEDALVLLKKEKCYSSFFINEILTLLIEAISSKNKSLISRAFLSLKIKLNQNFKIGEGLSLVPIDSELFEFREDLYHRIEKPFFIDNEILKKEKEKYVSYLEKYMDLVLSGQIFPSKSYKAMYDKESDKIEKLKILRNMIGEASDTYVIKIVNELEKTK